MTFFKRGLIVSIAAIAAVLLVQCAQGPETEQPEQDARPEGLMTAATAVDGWELTNEPLVYVGDSLYEMINGGAELYHQLGFVQALAAEYVDDDGRAISLEVFEMGDVEGAKNIFAEKTGGTGEPAPIGDEAAVESYYMNARVGRHLITITGFESDEETTRGILELAGAVASALGGQQ